MSDKTNTPEHQWLWELSNPGAIAGGLAGGSSPVRCWKGERSPVRADLV